MPFFAADWVGRKGIFMKNASRLRHFILQNNRFAKTGSGQTWGKHTQKRERERESGVFLLAVWVRTRKLPPRRGGGGGGGGGRWWGGSGSGCRRRCWRRRCRSRLLLATPSIIIVVVHHRFCPAPPPGLSSFLLPTARFARWRRSIIG